jgi:hypothetical protein
MAQAGLFRLVLQDDRFDRFFTASDFLRRRLAEIQKERTARGEACPQPTFADLEQTHILYLRAAYRPFATVVSEYVRVKPKGNAAALGPAGGTVEFDLPTFGDFTSDMVFHVRFQDLGAPNPRDSSGRYTNPAAPLYRFCAYPGLRLFTRVSLFSDETLIDDYVRDEAVFYNKFRIPADRRAAWVRGVGQAEVRTAEYQINNGRTGVYAYKDGLQTPRFHHPAQDLWVPLQFWMCADAANALLNDFIQNTQRKIVAELAPVSDIIKAFDMTTGAPLPLTPSGSFALNIDLYVNGIHVNPEIHDLFAAQVGFSLIRVHRRQWKTLTTPASGPVLLDQLKYPAEYLYVGVRDKAHAQDFDAWHLFGRKKERTADERLSIPAVIWGSSGAQLAYFDAQEADSFEPLVRELQLSAHGINLYPSPPASFFNAYAPQRYPAETSIVASADASAYLVPFCLYPGKSNPSGYYNLSAGRELYLNCQAEGVSVTRPAELVVTMSALNFLVRKGDKVHLLYSV